MYKRISEGENINETYSGNNAQINETNEREISELNLRATQENSDTSTQRNNENNKTGTNQEITPDTKLLQAAYHGTPHRFDEFTSEVRRI